MSITLLKITKPHHNKPTANEGLSSYNKNPLLDGPKILCVCVSRKSELVPMIIVSSHYPKIFRIW